MNGSTKDKNFLENVQSQLIAPNVGSSSSCQNATGWRQRFLWRNFISFLFKMKLKVALVDLIALAIEEFQSRQKVP